VIWEEGGLLTVTGGKLTTFRLIAQDAIKAVRNRLPGLPELKRNLPVLAPVDVNLPDDGHLNEAARRRLLGRYGALAPALTAAAHPGELDPIPGTKTLWAELRWAARSEQVCHLDDLLLRRTRLGLLLPQGGSAIFPILKPICQQGLGWSSKQWQAEVKRYKQLWAQCYSLPAAELVPDWKTPVAAALQRRAALPSIPRRVLPPTALVALLCALIILAIWLLRRRKAARGEIPDGV